jgi:hypothetical protein
MSIIIEVIDDEVFVHRNYYHEACFPHWKEGDIHEVESIEERHKCWECQEWIETKQGFSIGQHVYERDTLAPGTITAIDEDGIATVLFTNGSTDGISLEHLTSKVSYADKDILVEGDIEEFCEAF